MSRWWHAVLLLLVTLSASAQESPLIPPYERVAGQTQADWSRVWWQWAATFERYESPVADATGELCASHQSGDVFFLAGTYGTARTIRTCTVPRGKYLFFPIINYVVMPGRDRNLGCADAIAHVAQITDDLVKILLEVDGKPYEGLSLHRQATECFDLGALAAPPIRMYPTAANGYYVMLKPLPPGEHTINFGGWLPSMIQLVTYTIIVE